MGPARVDGAALGEVLALGFAVARAIAEGPLVTDTDMLAPSDAENARVGTCVKDPARELVADGVGECEGDAGREGDKEGDERVLSVAIAEAGRLCEEVSQPLGPLDNDAHVEDEGDGEAEVDTVVDADVDGEAESEEEARGVRDALEANDAVGEAVLQKEVRGVTDMVREPLPLFEFNADAGRLREFVEHAVAKLDKDTDVEGEGDGEAEVDTVVDADAEGEAETEAEARGEGDAVWDSEEDGEVVLQKEAREVCERVAADKVARWLREVVAHTVALLGNEKEKLEDRVGVAEAVAEDVAEAVIAVHTKSKLASKVVHVLATAARGPAPSTEVVHKLSEKASTTTPPEPESYAAK